MKTRFSNRRNHALTLIEVLVLIVVLAVLAAMFLPANSGSRRKDIAMRVACANNLKQIGLGYRLWAGDNNDKFPMEISVTNGGSMELPTARNAWINFLFTSNQLSTSMILRCPADTNLIAATNIEIGFNNKNVSYFVGLDANTNYSQSFLSGDDNFEIGGVPVKPGMLEFSASAPIGWSAARHKNAGNIGLDDGSVQVVNNSGLANLLHQTGVATNHLAIP
jgi:type II secretory pathway pseudopilin PulG